MAGERLLLVDDRKENLYSLEALLKPEGYALDKALSGEEALKMILIHEYCLILLDVQMPGMNGFEVARYVKSNPKTREIPIIFITAISRDDEFINEGFASGAYDYITKPIQSTPLVLNKIRTFVDLYEQKTELLEVRNKLNHLNEMLANKADTSEKKYASLFNESNDANLLLANNGEITDINLKAEEMFGFQRKELVGKNFSKLFENRKNAVSELREILDTEKHSYESMVSTKSGAFPAEITVSLIDLGEDEVILAIIRDITERKAHEHKLEEGKKRVEDIYNITSAPTSFMEQFRSLLEAMTHQLGMETAGFFRAADEKFHIEFHHPQNDLQLSEGDSFMSKNSLCQATLQTSGILAIPDISNSTYTNYHLAPNIKSAGAYLGTSVKVKGRDFGVLSFMASKPSEEFSGTDQSLLLLASQWMGSAVERHMHERELTDAKNQLEEAQEIAEMGHWEWDLNTNQMAWAGLLYSIHGLKPATFKPSWDSILQMVHPEDQKEFDRVISQAIEKKASFNIEYRVSLGRRRTKWIHTLGVAEVADDGRLAKLYGTSQDVTQRRKAGRKIETLNRNLKEKVKQLNNYHFHLEKLVEERTSELKMAQQAAERANHAKSDFLARMSHEIRTPMNAIIGLTHLCLESPLSKKQRSFLDNVYSASQALLVIINDILDFSKIEAGKLDIERIEFSIDKLFEDLSTVVSYRAIEKNLDLLFEITPGVPARAMGDPLRLNQILINLVNNAIKFTDEGQVKITCKVKEENQKSYCLEFSVHDTGIGISKEQTGKLFQSFSQADTSTTRRFGGTGLGLVVCQRLTQMMGGKIWVQSAPGKGSTFNFTTTLYKTHTVKDQVFSLTKEYKGKQVLLFDSHYASAKILESYLQLLGLKVDKVNAPEQVVGSLISSRCDLLFMDSGAPGKECLTILSKIQKEQLIDQSRVILLTNAGHNDIQDDLEHLGIGEVLSKPFTRSAVNDVVVNLLGKGSQGSRRGKRRSKDKETDEREKVRGAKVLLVEDNEINQEIAVELLTGAGVQVEIANDGKEGVEKASRNQYDTVFMDVQMPVMDGYEATQEIRKLKSHEELPVIAMTADAISGVRDKCMEAGMDDFLTKPIEVDQVFRVLAKWANKRNGITL